MKRPIGITLPIGRNEILTNFDCGDYCASSLPWLRKVKTSSRTLWANALSSCIELRTRVPAALLPSRENFSKSVAIAATSRWSSAKRLVGAEVSDSVVWVSLLVSIRADTLPRDSDIGKNAWIRGKLLDLWEQGAG